MLSNNKFLGKCWYERYPWIRLAVECESMVEKGINFSFCLGSPMIYLAWKVLGTTQSFSLTGKACHPKCFISIFSPCTLAPLQIPTSLCEGPIYLLYAISIFIWFFVFSHKAPTTGHYDRTWALGIANMQVCMNGSMIEHNGLGPTCFSVDILKYMVACCMLEY